MILISLILIISLPGIFQGQVLAAPVAAITLNPSEGFVGTIVTVTGSWFAPNSTITVSWYGQAIATNPETVITQEDGTFNCEITVPETGYGEYSVAATDSEVNSGEATFYVLPVLEKQINQMIKAVGKLMIALPIMAVEVVDAFFDVGRLRLTDRGQEFAANLTVVISDGVEYVAQWLAARLGG
jgi:hypothetical protein